MKLRPVLLLTGTIGLVPEVLVAYISSVVPPHPLASDLVIDPETPEFATTYLKVVSVLRLHKLATIHATSVMRYLGTLDSARYEIVGEKLRKLLGLDR